MWIDEGECSTARGLATIGGVVILRGYDKISRECHPERSEGSRPRALKADRWRLQPHGTRSFVAPLLRMTPLSIFSQAPQDDVTDPGSDETLMTSEETPDHA